MTIEELAKTITAAPNFYSIQAPLTEIGALLNAEARSLGIIDQAKRCEYIKSQLIRLDRLCGWDVANRTQTEEEAIYGMLAYLYAYKF